jgi:hypothetical protein
MPDYQIGIIYEHPEWHLPLFKALQERGVNYVKINLAKGAFIDNDLPKASLYYNMVSPSANLRGNQRAIPFANSICRRLELSGYKVINGSGSLAFEISKSSQLSLLSSLGIDHPRSIIFNDVGVVENKLHGMKFPMILKPEQGGSGARIFLLHSYAELQTLLGLQPELWLPDNLLILQEYLEYDHEFGIVRLEFIGEELLYAMRVVTHGNFNLCPSVICNPEEGEGTCSLPEEDKKPEFFPYFAVPKDAVLEAKQILRAAGHSTGSVEYLETLNGRRVYYDINSNSNLRIPIANAFKKDPFNELVSFLLLECEKQKEIKMENFLINQ